MDQKRGMEVWKPLYGRKAKGIIYNEYSGEDAKQREFVVKFVNGNMNLVCSWISCNVCSYIL